MPLAYTTRNGSQDYPTRQSPPFSPEPAPAHGTRCRSNPPLSTNLRPPLKCSSIRFHCPASPLGRQTSGGKGIYCGRASLPFPFWLRSLPLALCLVLLCSLLFYPLFFLLFCLPLPVPFWRAVCGVVLAVASVPSRWLSIQVTLHVRGERRRTRSFAFFFLPSARTFLPAALAFPLLPLVT